MNKKIAMAVRGLINSIVQQYLSQYHEDEYEYRSIVLNEFLEWLYFQINNKE